ncbi:MAG: hypothetical protein FJ265_09860 [Planctomycetes bacterium]|nr:hypothetical protein [Planctomycetota bacterium]
MNGTSPPAIRAGRACPGCGLHRRIAAITTLAPRLPRLVALGAGNLARGAPALRTWFGRERRCPQPARRWADGTTLALY